MEVAVEAVAEVAVEVAVEAVAEAVAEVAAEVAAEAKMKFTSQIQEWVPAQFPATTTYIGSIAIVSYLEVAPRFPTTIT